MHNKTKTIAISLSSILFLATLIVPSVYADESIVDVVTINVPVSCSMSASGTDSHTASVNNGQTTGNIGTTNLKVICNDNSGYAIYAIGYTDDTYGKTVLTSSTLGSTHDITTATTVTTGTSSWAMKLASVSGTYAPIIAGSTGDSLKQTGDPDFSDYTAVPEEYTKVAYYTSSTDTGNNATGSNLTTTYRTYISPSQPAGTYVGQVKYTLVHPNMNDDSNKPPEPLQANDCPANSICYAPNAPNLIGDMSSIGTISASSKAGKQTKTDSSNSTDISSNGEAVLIAPNFKREGYGFAGWSTEWDATTATNPTIYGPNETITVPDVSSHGLILYPVWIASAGNLQGTNGQGWTGCSSLTHATYDSTNNKMVATLSSITALTDTRDGNVYAIARLADGKCWMIENLRLNAENSRGADNIAKAQGYGQSTTYGSFIGLADSVDYFESTTPSTINEVITPNSIYYAETQSGTATVDIIRNYYVESRLPQYNNNNTNMATNATNSGNTTLVDNYNGTSNNTRWFGYGNYYNWPAAMASTKYYTYYYNVENIEQYDSDAAGTSICPKGWKLPLGVASTGTINGLLQDEASDSNNRVGGFSYLDRKMGGTGENQSNDAGIAQSKKWRSFPNNFVHSGYVLGSVFRNRSTRGIYISSSASSYKTYNCLSLNNDNTTNPGTCSTNKRTGQSVRCVAQ